ncbi:MAG: aromatic acid/H+ symport family MFS transporter [Acidovorax sp.]|nr:aromatic acid/H+ symport family MFS transporter [Acidovorax sp.]
MPVSAASTSPQDEAVDVQTVLNEHRFSGYQWLIFALCFGIVLLDGFDTAAIGYIAPSLMAEWGVSKPALAPVLSAALFGLAGGALLSGPLADRLGRKRVLEGACGLFGLACLGSAFAQDLHTLTALRFVTGLGLGAAMPNAVTLMSEYCPDARRSTITNAMFCGFPLGAAFGGFLAAWMIPLWGWRSVLLLGGVAPLLLVLGLCFLLPESVRHMVARQYPSEQIRQVLQRMTGASLAGVRRFTMTESKPVADGQSGLAVVLSRSYWLGSVMLWLAYFMGLVIFYALVNWMPLLLKDAGLDTRTSTLVAALFPLGGVGAVFFGWLMDRFNANRIIAIGYALTAASIWWIGQEVGHLGWLVLAVLVAGTLMNTAQSSMPALAATFYPTSGRATGVAWMLGMGRFGGIAGSFLVAELTARQLDFSSIFAVVAVPGLIAMAALIVKQLAAPRTQSAPGVQGPADVSHAPTSEGLS